MSYNLFNKRIPFEKNYQPSHRFNVVFRELRVIKRNKVHVFLVDLDLRLSKRILNRIAILPTVCIRNHLPLVVISHFLNYVLYTPIHT